VFGVGIPLRELTEGLGSWLKLSIGPLYFMLLDRYLSYLSFSAERDRQPSGRARPTGDIRQRLEDDPETSHPRRA
jgi:hypothetical protein